MSHTHDDPRVTAYVFGELTPEEATSFEKELEQSPELNQEVAAVRETVAAIQHEFASRGSNLSESQQRTVEQAIRRDTQSPAQSVTSASISSQGATSRRAVFAVVLAASVLLVAALSLPYWSSPSQIEISMKSEPPETAATSSDDIELPGSDVQAIESAIESASESGIDEAMDGAVDGALEADSSAPGAGAGAGRGRGQMEVAEGPPIETTAPQPVPAPENAPEDATSLLGLGDAPAPRSPRSIRMSTRLELEAADNFRVDREALKAAMEEESARQSDQDSLRQELRFGTAGRGDRSAAPAELEKQSADSAASEAHPFGPAPAGSVDAFGGADPFGPGQARSVDSFVDPFGRPLDLQPEGGRTDASGDRYATIQDNPFVEVAQAPLSTFSIDVDTASYGKLRSLLRNNILPRPDAVRIEELLNYFDYDYPGPDGDHPFAASMEIAECPWNRDHRLARIGIRAKEIESQRPSSNLVFLLDVSGSMNEPAKLPLVIEGMKLLTDQLTENDKVAIVVYAGAAGVVLESTRGDKKQLITESLDRLQAGGSTNGGQGIVLAYQIARDHFIPGGTNRVILCSDGDFNVGVTGTEELVQIAKENAQSNIFLSVLGFGYGNHNDEMMERVSNEGNGNYAFIDSKREAEKVFVEELGGTLVTVAKDVKVQVELNPKQVGSYRLIGYENRMLQSQDFANDKKDAGEIGAGHTVTALYELVPPPSGAGAAASGDELRYQTANELTDLADSEEVLLLKLRYKQPDGETSTLMEIPVTDKGKSFQQTDRDFQFAAAVAEFGMLLRDSPHRGSASFSDVLSIAREAAKGDDFGYRTEFVELVEKAQALRGQ